MPSNLKKLVLAHMEKTGQSWQTALRHVRERTTPLPTGIPPQVAELLNSLHISATFGILVGRVPATGASADLQVAIKRSRELAEHPLYYAASGSVERLISLAEHDLLIAHGAADDRHVQLLRSYKPEGELLKVFQHGTFSDRCENCDGWIWCGEKEQNREADCVCGQRYRVSFDQIVHRVWKMRQGPCCIDCGAELKAPMEPGDDPWRPVNEWQLRCNTCHLVVPRTPEQLAAAKWRIRRRYQGLVVAQAAAIVGTDARPR